MYIYIYGGCFDARVFIYTVESNQSASAISQPISIRRFLANQRRVYTKICYNRANEKPVRKRETGEKNLPLIGAAMVSLISAAMVLGPPAVQNKSIICEKPLLH